ncbi:MAG: GatB/YqeY domain-containing protein [Thermoanaerobaculia bacterium]
MQETPQQRISRELRAAMKSGDKVRLSALRMLLTEIQSAGLRGPATGGELDEAGFQALVRKAIKQRRESAEQFRLGNRPELAAKEDVEAEIFVAYLPRQASEEELRQAIELLVAGIASQGLEGKASLGAVMKAALAQFAGTADGAAVNRIARELLAGG